VGFRKRRHNWKGTSMNHVDKQLAYLVLRLALGVNMFIHGVGRLGGNYEKFVAGTVGQFAASPLPALSVSIFGHIIPFLETVIGLLLVLGFATRFVSVIGGLVMVSLIFGMGILQKWDIVGIQMVYILFYFLLLFLIEWNRYSVDGWLEKNASIPKATPARSAPRLP
jgi:thiosulfate dehydrogenase [quinone] large subunit